MQNPAALLFTHPAFLVAASAAVFLVIVWIMLPFALYGIRKRLDRNRDSLDKIADTLGQILQVLERPEWIRAGSGQVAAIGEEDPDGPESSGKLFAAVRKELQQFGPFVKERLIEPGEIEFYVQDKDGEEVPCLYLSFLERGVRVSIPVVSLEKVFPGFSSGQFREYANSFLPEKNGYFMEPSSSGLESHVIIEPRENNALDLFIGIIREQLVDAIKGD